MAVFISGKSTIMGHLLYLIGQVDQKVMHRYKGKNEFFSHFH
jgi:translation elongation factor EF-1alpha